MTGSEYDGPFFMYVTAYDSFEDYDEAMEHGPILKSWVWCETCEDWMDIWFNPQTHQEVCIDCSAAERQRQGAYAQRRRQELAALAAWTEGKPI